MKELLREETGMGSLLQNVPGKAADLTAVGKRFPNIDARDKVMGRAQFVSDLRLPGMLYGKVLRSPLPHARILNVDCSRALKLPGVKAVLTGRDCPAHKFGVMVPDETILAGDRVRFVGDEVAIVAATDPDLAEEAMALVQVEYEELPAVYDPREAAREGAPLLHAAERNIASHVFIDRGDVEKAWQEAEFISEEEFSTSLVYQAYMETMAAVAAPDTGGRVVVWAGAQNPSAARLSYAQALGLPPENMRVIQPFFGGGFGAKMEHKTPLLAAFAALQTGLPVRVVNSREEDFQAGLPRVPMYIRQKLGVKKDGEILAKEVHIVGDNGAYTNYAPAIVSTACYRIDLLYTIPNVRAEADLVYTNKVPTGCFRGFGNAQAHFAMESHLDIIAEGLGLDPMEMRLKNAAYSGYVNPHGWKVGSCALGECIEKVTQGIGWEDKRSQPTAEREDADRKVKRGVGMACCMHVSGNRSFKKEFDGSAALVRLDDGGNAVVYSGEADLGQGSRTVFAQITAEELGIPMERVRAAIIDTDMVPFAWGTFASRATFLGGNAVRMAALDARRQVLETAASMLKAPDAKLDLKNGMVVGPGMEKSLSLAEVTKEYMYRHAGGNIIGRGYYMPDVEYPDAAKYGNISGAYPFAAQAAEVEVDTETGRVRVLRLVAAHDLGKAINPMLAEGQIEGGVGMGLGWALSENMVYGPDGHLANPEFLDYQIPTAVDMPDMEVYLVESDERNGPFGAKSLGEPALIPTSPAIANAVANALGVRIKELPLTAEKVMQAWRKRMEGGGNDAAI